MSTDSRKMFDRMSDVGCRKIRLEILGKYLELKNMKVCNKKTTITVPLV